MRAWVSDHAVEFALFGTFAGLAIGTFAAFGVVPLVIWSALSAIAAPIVGRAMDSDEAFDVMLDDREELE